MTRTGKPPLPLPEVVDLGDWRISASPGDGRESSAGLDALTGRGGNLRVPLGGGQRERYVRAHELGHVAWTPRGAFPPHIGEVTMQHTEDARIARRLGAVGIHAEVRLLPDEELWGTAARLAERKVSRLDAASMLLATIDVPDGEVLARAIATVDPRMPRAVEKIWAETIGRDEKPEFHRSVEAAEQLVQRFGKDSESSGGRFARLVRLALPGTSGGRGDRGASEPEDEPSWGPLSTLDPPRPLRLAPRRGVGVGWRAADEGTRLGDPSRFYRDGRAWRTRRRRRQVGGTVLIDCSGSMSLSPDQLESLVEANPAALIATYSGDEDKTRGRLHVVARQGRRVRPDQVRPPGIYNVCDGPALEWLGSQPTPRVWVSDGAVTGTGDVPSTALRTEAAAIVRRHGIRRVESAEALIGEWRAPARRQQAAGGQRTV